MSAPVAIGARAAGILCDYLKWIAKNENPPGAVARPADSLDADGPRSAAFRAALLDFGAERDSASIV